MKFRLTFRRELLLEHRVSEVVKKAAHASSIANSQTKIVPHILRLVELITADQAFGIPFIGKRNCDKTFVTVPS